MYNLSVAVAETYYVGEGQWLVHNCGDPRNIEGTVSGRQFSNPNRMMHGTHGNVGVIPEDVAAQLRGQNFKSWDDFREAFWKAVGNTKYAGEFSSSNQSRMRDGLAPISVDEQQYGAHKSYILHHKQPIQHGGGVYDLNNLVIVTPRYHQDVLDGSYHFGSNK